MTDEAKNTSSANDAATEESREAMSSGAKTEKKTGWRADVGEFVRVWLPALALFFFLRGTVAEARYIPSGSMLPTLRIHDYIIVEKLSKLFSANSYRHGDILVFYPPLVETGQPDPEYPIVRVFPFIPEHPPAFIKRVVGLPGDRIEVKSDVGIFVNGKLVHEGPGVPKPLYSLETLSDIQGGSMSGKYIQPYGKSTAPIVVPEHCLFMLGDNHNNSADGHVWGFVEQSRVVGKVCMTIPISRIYDLLPGGSKPSED